MESITLNLPDRLHRRLVNTATRRPLAEVVIHALEVGALPARSDVQPKSLNQMTQDAIAILMKAIGIANTLRFLNQFSTGYGNYTEGREARFKDLTLAELLQQMGEQQ